jgi:hypothetical protein
VKVYELIEKLQKFDEDLDVLVSTFDAEEWDSFNAPLDSVYQDHEGVIIV